MKYDTSITEEKGKFMKEATRLYYSGKIVEIKEVKKRRSSNQNSYLHLIIAYFGSHFGYTAEEAKMIYKEVNKDIYRYEKKGRVFWRSSRELKTDEMAKTIDRFIQKSAENGLEIPPATNTEWLRQIENEIEKTNYYL